ncbi:MAG: glycine/betaine ABC transporter, partial [Pseudomonadota bacterium]
MNVMLSTPPVAEGSSDTLDFEGERRAQITEFVRTSPDYYISQFGKISRSAQFTPTINLAAGLLGPVWFGARGLWKWAFAFLIVETFAFVQMALGWFGDLGATARERIASIEGTLALRERQLVAAIENNTDKVDVYQRAVDSLQAAIGGIRLEAQQAQEQGIWIALTGVVALLVVKAIQTVVANSLLEARFSDWLSERSIASGMPGSHMLLSAVFFVLIVTAAVTHYAFPGSFGLLTEFPTDPQIRLTSIEWVEGFFNAAVTNGD